MEKNDLKNVIKDELILDIKEYCSLNNILFEKFINELIRDAFTIVKYGVSPPFLSDEKKCDNKINFFEYNSKETNDNKEITNVKHRKIKAK